MCRRSSSSATSAADRRRFGLSRSHLLSFIGQEWRREFPVEVLNQLAAAYDSWKDEDGLRTTSLRSLNHAWEL